MWARRSEVHKTGPERPGTWVSESRLTCKQEASDILKSYPLTSPGKCSSSGKKQNESQVPSGSGHTGTMSELCFCSAPSHQPPTVGGCSLRHPAHPTSPRCLLGGPSAEQRGVCEIGSVRPGMKHDQSLQNRSTKDGFNKMEGCFQ